MPTTVVADADNENVSKLLEPYIQSGALAVLALARNLGLITGASAMDAIFTAASAGALGRPAGGQAVRRWRLAFLRS
jgi:hypothetical protein